MTPFCFEARQLVKHYGSKAVVDGLSFCVREGEIVGLLGPNGAGKTTAFYMSIGLIRPDGGEVWFQGQNVTENMERSCRKKNSYFWYRHVICSK